MRIGADDYITKDISTNYLVVRLEALFRRIESLAGGAGQPADQHKLELDRGKSQARWNGDQLDIPLTHYWILEALASRPGQILSHDELMKAANLVVEPNTIIAYIRKLRNTIREIEPSFDCIKTERGRGYRWVDMD